MNAVSFASFHDAEITGLSHDAQRAELTFHCRTVDGINQLLTFWGVKAWRLSEFEDQNVVFALREFDGGAWRESEEGREDYFRDVMVTVGSSDLVYRVESSVGMEGCVVAAGCRVERRRVGNMPLGKPLMPGRE